MTKIQLTFMLLSFTIFSCVNPDSDLIERIELDSGLDLPTCVTVISEKMQNDLPVDKVEVELMLGDCVNIEELIPKSELIKNKEELPLKKLDGKWESHHGEYYMCQSNYKDTTKRVSISISTSTRTLKYTCIHI